MSHQLATAGDGRLLLFSSGSPFRTRAPLTGHRVLTTRESDAAEAAISDHLWPTRLRIDTDPSRFRADLHHASLGTIGLAWLSFGDADVSATFAAHPSGHPHSSGHPHPSGHLHSSGRPDPDEPAVLVALPWHGRVESWQGRQRALITGNDAVVIQPGRTTVTHWHPTAALLLVVLPRHLVAETLGDLTGGPTPPPSFDLAQPGLASWARLVRALCHLLDLTDHHPVTSRHTQQAVTAALLTAARHDQSERIRDTFPGLPGRRVRAATHWIHAHHGNQAIGPADIARACGMSERTLYRAIRAETGMTPASYLKRVRLVAARAALRAATPAETTVTEVAGRVGFGDLSWFAVQYQRVYGERPVDTLRAQPTP